MRRGKIWVALAGILAIALVGSVSAEAAGRDVQVHAKVPTHGGARVAFEAERYRHGSYAGFVAARRSRHGGSVAEYLRTRGTRVSAKRVRAQVRGRMSVAARFVEQSRRVITSPDCDGKRVVMRGALVGRVRFVGEHRYATANRHRVPARVTVDTTRCVVGIQRPEVERATFVDLIACPSRDLIYDASRGGGGGRNVSSFHIASTADVGRGKATWRYVVRLVGRGGMTFSKDLSAATVDPGGPFSGNGSYSDHMLTGNLAVRFLGIRHSTPLAPAEARLRKSHDGSQSLACGHRSSGSATASVRSALRRSVGPALSLVRHLELAARVRRSLAP